MKFYNSEVINENLTCIRSESGELLYLLNGEKNALLIDSCVGIGHLKEFVKSLTDRPVTLVLTHGHVDHAMGAPEFETVYMNHKDLAIYREQCDLEHRKEYMSAALGDRAADIPDIEYTAAAPDQQFIPLTDGMIIEAEPFHLECYEFPGHTPGSMVFFIREIGILILGDACNNSTFLFDENSTSVEEYREAVLKNKKRLAGKYDRVFLSHHVMETDITLMDNMLDVCDMVLNGTADDIPFEFMGMQAYIAVKCSPRFEREDKKNGNIIYNKKKRFKEGQR